VKTPVFITGNQYKADYLAKWLDSPIEHCKLDLDEIQAVAQVKSFLTATAN